MRFTTPVILAGGSGSTSVRQVLLFGFIGVTQLVADALIFYLLVKLSVPPWIANSTSRLFAFLLGFVLNGTFTFRRPEGSSAVSKKSFIRLLLLWVALTFVSSELMTAASHVASDIRLLMIKFAVEFVLAFVSFFVSKTWVYR